MMVVVMGMTMTRFLEPGELAMAETGSKLCLCMLDCCHDMASRRALCERTVAVEARVRPLRVISVKSEGNGGR